MSLELRNQYHTNPKGECDIDFSGSHVIFNLYSPFSKFCYFTWKDLHFGCFLNKIFYWHIFHLKGECKWSLIKQSRFQIEHRMLCSSQTTTKILNTLVNGEYIFWEYNKFMAKIPSFLRNCWLFKPSIPVCI